jgi:hypothetical protein
LCNEKGFEPLELIDTLNLPILKLPAFNLHLTKLRAMTYLIGRALAKVNITTNEEIINVIYTIDGNTDFKAIVNEPPYDWKIQKSCMSLFRLIGKQRLGVYASTTTGKTAYDEMDFFAITPI